jgi:hypothetical protein
MTRAGHALTVVALALMVVALTPGGNLTQWVAGLILLLAGSGFGSLADNQALRYGGGARA